MCKASAKTLNKCSLNAVEMRWKCNAEGERHCQIMVYMNIWVYWFNGK